MTVPLWVWAATVAGIGLLVAVDVYQARRPHVVGFREAALWSGVYVGAAGVFGLGVLAFGGSAAGTEFFAGYLVEKSLSVDNLFVLAVILGRFAVPARHQQRVLLIGMLGALGLRAVSITVGAAALDRFSVLFVVFGAFLVYTAVKLVRSSGVDPGPGRLVSLVRRVVPVTDDSSGRLFTRGGGRFAVTTLGLAVAAVISADVVFALDSVPAIFGITDSVYLVFTTNALALLGLRALYFLLVGLLDRLVHLHYGLALVLGFIGVKLTLHYLHGVWPSVPAIPTMLSLAFIVAVLATVTVTSLRATRPTTVSTEDGAGSPARRG